MNYDVTAIKQKTDIIRLAEMAGAKFRGSGAKRQAACPLHGGDNPTALNVWVGADGSQLYKCQTHESDCNQYGNDVIAFVRKWRGVSFREACEILGGDVQKNITPRTVTPIPPKPINIPSAEWQRQAWQEIDAASAALRTSRIAVDFLSARAIHAPAWDAWRLGVADVYDPIAKRKRPALVIPWYDLDSMGETLTAVKYRFIGNDPEHFPNVRETLRYSCKPGSKFDVPFGLWDALPDYHHSLLFVEGELNCISVWQCRPAGVSVLSFGSEGGGDNRVMQSLANRYKNVYVWADDVWDKQVNHAKELRALVRGRGKALRSPKDDGIKHDANQLLKVGALPEFLSRVLDVECENIRGEK